MLKKTVLHPLFYFIVLAIALVIATSFAISKCNKKKEVTHTIKQQAVKDAPVQHYTDNAGTDHAAKPVAEAQDNEAMLDYYQSIIDSQATLLDVKSKYIKEHLSVGTVSTGSVNGTAQDYDEKAQPCPDSLQFMDRWFKGIASKDTGWHLNYQVKDSIVFNQYEKKKGWFSRQLFMDGYSLNPNTRITGLSNIKITPAKKRWGIGATIIVTYDGSKWKPVAGVGLQYNFIRF
jgi:hypothetical protein